MIDISLSQRERDVILDWFEISMERREHWGDGRATFPDEAIVVKKLKGRRDEPLRMTATSLALIVQWSEARAGSVEDGRLAMKLKEALARG